MEILYVSSVPSPGEFRCIKNHIKENINVATYGMNESGFKFHTLIIDGLRANGDVRILSLVGRSVSPKTHRGTVWKRVDEQYADNVIYRHVGFLNIPFIKQFSVCFSFFHQTLRWLAHNRHNEDKYIIMDAAYVTVLPFVIGAANLYRCKKTAVFCDIYEYMGAVKDARESENVRFVHRLFRRLSGRMYRKLDGFILLTEKMNQVVNLSQKPYAIIEGLVDIHMSAVDNRPEHKTDKNVVMYAGALREQYGLKNLVEGFMRYEDENARLWIYGAGDYSNEITKAARADARILFYGLADLEEVVKREIEADVLINPRPANREFTQFSFPSKIMEYMVSATPVLTTRLPGIPDEYYDYIFTIDADAPEDITRALQRVFCLTKNALHEKGRMAKQFVLEKKNNVEQAAAIIKLLRNE